jgi:hypothetical protein
MLKVNNFSPNIVTNLEGAPIATCGGVEVARNLVLLVNAVASLDAAENELAEQRAIIQAVTALRSLRKAVR